MSKRKGIEYDEATNEKKLIKLYKALKMMESSKHLDPKFSDGAKELIFHIMSLRVSTNF